MRRALIILLVLDVIAAVALIVRVESLIEGVEVAAYHLPQFVEFAKTNTADSGRFQKIADHQALSIGRTRDYAQSVRVVVQVVALLLVVNAAFFWYVRRRWQTTIVSRTHLPQQR